jgi:putative DNA primase/helicase
VRGFIETHGASRFQDLAQPDTVCYHRAGFRDASAQEYVFLAQGLSEAAGGVKADRAARVLDAAGWIRREGGRNQARRSLPGLGRVRCYVVQLPQDATDTDQACGAARPARMVQ